MEAALLINIVTGETTASLQKKEEIKNDGFIG